MTPPTIRADEKHNGLKKPMELADNLDYSIWVDCEFTDCELSGTEMSSAIFSKCVFEDVSLYWSSGFQSTFIDSKFLRCDLRAWFDDARFIRCSFVECEVGDDGLGGTTEWENAVAFDCVVSGDPLPIVTSKEESRAEQDAGDQAPAAVE